MRLLFYMQVRLDFDTLQHDRQRLVDIDGSLEDSRRYACVVERHPQKSSIRASQPQLASVKMP